MTQSRPSDSPIDKLIVPQDAAAPDDLLIACNSFEERCLGVARVLGETYQTRFTCVFRFEPNIDEPAQFEVDRERHFKVLHSRLSEKTLEGVIPIFCNRQDVDDGIGQFRQLFSGHLAVHGCSSITIDITCFTKLYLLELMYFLLEENTSLRVRAVYNRAQAYGSGKLTKGLGKISHIPHFAGQFLPTQDTVLIAFLGFETERALGIWEHYEPFRTIVVLADPPSRGEYLKRAEDLNAFLLSRPAVIRTTMNPYDPFEVAHRLEEIYLEKCTDKGREVYNVGIISLGTKVQALGLFLFWKKHKNVRITYAFPQEYGKGYSSRLPGDNLLFQLS